MKSKSSPSNRKKAAAAKKAEEDERMVRYLTGPHGPAASTLHTALKLVVPNNPEILPDIKLLRGGLEKNGHQVIQGNLSGVETTLESQATVLGYLFNQMAQLALNHKLGSDTFDRTFRLALRAQAQSARTLEILANLKQGPRVVFAQQLNTAHQQIVNNAAPTEEAESPRIVRSALNETPAPTGNALGDPTIHPNYATLDPRSPRETTPVHPPLAAMDPIHRPQKPIREADQQPER
jgi:hypothetical protein